MSKKEEKRLQRRKQAVRFVVIPYIFGLAMLILGIWGLVSNNGDLRAYQRSDDVRKVEATVTYAAIRQEKDLTGTLEDVWDAEVDYEAEGQKYSGEITRSKELKPGDTVTIEVYRTKKGEYKIPTFTDSTDKGVSNILMYAAIGVGVVVIGGATFYLADELKKNSPKKKSQPRQGS